MIVLYGIEILLGIIVIVTILMQPSKSDALSGLIQGNSTESFFTKNKSRTKEVILEKLTVIFMFLFICNSIILTII